MLTRHDLSEALLDTAYGMLQQFFGRGYGGEAALDGARRPRSDRIHRRAGRDGRVERHTGLEGDAQLVDTHRAGVTR